MRKTEKERKQTGTAGRKRVQDLLAVLFFLLLLPYTCSLVSGARPEEAVETSGAALRGDGEDGAAVYLERDNGVQRVPLEEFVLGALAACMPGEYREETLKAQAVILRSICRAGGGADGASAGESDATADGQSASAGDPGTSANDPGALAGDPGVSAGDPGASAGDPGTSAGGPGTAAGEQNASIRLRTEERLSYLDETQRRAYWGADREELEEKFAGAVKATEGIVLTLGGEAVSPPFFRLSAGKTRDASQIWGEGTFGWCKSVDCPHDIEAADFLCEKTLSWEHFLKTLGKEGLELSGQDVRMKLTRDGAGYVTAVECGGVRLAGERFRQLFELPSACFALQEKDGEVLLRTKGVGHGLGFDQYGADLLAAEGKDYIQLLNAFFEGLTLEKME